MAGLLLAGFLLVADYQLVVQGSPETICAKSAETCEAARAAIAKGWIMRDLPRGTPTRCMPHPGCFPAESDCINGFNCTSRGRQ